MEKFYEIMAYILIGIIGLCVGSFLNVVIYRLSEGISLAKPSSHCPNCKYKLKWYDNIPLLSYCLLGGKCRKCKTHIPFRYTMVELLNMLLWLGCAFIFWETSIFLACIYMGAVSVFICVFFIDLEHKIIFDRFQIILAVFGVMSIFCDKYTQWYSHLRGGAVGFGVFCLVAVVFKKITEKDGLGGGDIKLVGVVGLLLGWEKLILSLIVATIPAAIIMAIASKGKEGEAREFPFAPFLTFGFTVAMLFGEQIINLYLKIIGI